MNVGLHLPLFSPLWFLTALAGFAGGYAAGLVHFHLLRTVADRLLRALKDAGLGSARVEGLPHCDWVLIDTSDVIVHIFQPEVRSFYNLEKMWSMANATDRARA